MASLVPLQLALQPQTHVLATNITQALRCHFLPTAIVLECSSSGALDSVRSLQDRFPKTPVIVMRHNGCAGSERSEDLRADSIVESNSVGGAMAELARFRAINHATELQAAVTAAVKFMAAHYAGPVTVREIADATSLSEGRLAHIFREATGFSVKDYMTRLRVGISQRLLLETT